jgi:hypothetical protein
MYQKEYSLLFGIPHTGKAAHIRRRTIVAHASHNDIGAVGSGTNDVKVLYFMPLLGTETAQLACFTRDLLVIYVFFCRGLHVQFVGL